MNPVTRVGSAKFTLLPARPTPHRLSGHPIGTIHPESTGKGQPSVTTTADTPEQADLSRALGAAFDAAGPATLRVLAVQPAAFGGWMIHGDGSHGSPGLVDEAATYSRQRTDTDAGSNRRTPLRTGRMRMSSKSSSAVLARRGVVDTSLRSVAAELGTSARMLVY